MSLWTCPREHCLSHRSPDPTQDGPKCYSCECVRPEASQAASLEESLETLRKVRGESKPGHWGGITWMDAGSER